VSVEILCEPVLSTIPSQKENQNNNLEAAKEEKTTDLMGPE